VLKQVYADEFTLHPRTTKVINSFLNDIFDRISKEAGLLVEKSGKSTIGPREIQSAVKLILNGELGMHAVNEGIKAVRKYDPSLV